MEAATAGTRRVDAAVEVLGIAQLGVVPRGGGQRHALGVHSSPSRTSQPRAFLARGSERSATCSTLSVRYREAAPSRPRGFLREADPAAFATERRNFPGPGAAVFFPRGRLPCCASAADSRGPMPTPAVWPRCACVVVASRPFRAGHRSCAIRPARAEYGEASAASAAPCLNVAWEITR